MQIHSLKRAHPNRKSRQVGRGGKRGKTSGRGTKGQKARAGHRIRPEWRDLIKKLPKQRGRGKHGNKSIEKKPVVLSLSKVDASFAKGETVSPRTLFEKGLLDKNNGRLPAVKILSGGEIAKELTFANLSVSKAAARKINTAGGKAE